MAYLSLFFYTSMIEATSTTAIVQNTKKNKKFVNSIAIVIKDLLCLFVI